MLPGTLREVFADFGPATPDYPARQALATLAGALLTLTQLSPTHVNH